MEYFIIIVYIILSWGFLSQLQNSMGIVFFGALDEYFIMKLVFAAVFGWIIIPIGLLIMIFKIIANK